MDESKHPKREQIKLVFQILQKEYLINKNELLGDLQDPITVISLLERYSPAQVAEILAEEHNIGRIYQ